MILRIDTHGGVPIYRQIIDHVRREIMTGQLVAGDRLEQVRSLAGRIKVNPMTVSKAYTILEREGLLQRKRGVGLFVAPLRKDVKKRIKAEMLEHVLREAAAIAVQMDLSEGEARGQFEKYYRQYRLKKGRRPDET
jgi:GntR family transcriptional regulator